MIEIMILAMIMGVVVKRGAEDLIHSARGGTPPRLAAAKARRQSGAAGRYWGQVWDDVWTDKAARRAARKSGTTPVRTPKPRGAATRFFAGLAQDGRRAAGRSWEDGWSRLDEKRRTRTTRPRPGQVTVPGTVVPNAQDEDGVRPQDHPGPEPRTVPTEDGRTDPRFGEDETDPTGTSSCPKCWGTVLAEDEVCPSCLTRQDRTQHHDDQSPPVYNGWDYEPTSDFFGHDLNDDGDEPDDPSPAPPTTEGTPTMTTIPTGEISGLTDMIQFCESSAGAFSAQIHATELSIAAAAAGGVTGPGAAKLAQAMELCSAAAAVYAEAAAEYKSHTGILEQYDANPGAGTREFITAGR